MLSWSCMQQADGQDSFCNAQAKPADCHSSQVLACSALRCKRHSVFATHPHMTVSTCCKEYHQFVLHTCRMLPLFSYYLMSLCVLSQHDLRQLLHNSLQQLMSKCHACMSTDFASSQLAKAIFRRKQHQASCSAVIPVTDFYFLLQHARLLTSA